MRYHHINVQISFRIKQCQNTQKAEIIQECDEMLVLQAELGLFALLVPLH